MKILVLNYEYPPIGGGGGIIAKYLSEGLARLGNRVTVVTTYFERREEKGERREERYNYFISSRRDDMLVANRDTGYNPEPRRDEILVGDEDSDIPSEPQRGDSTVADQGWVNPSKSRRDDSKIVSIEINGDLRIIPLHSRRKRSFQSNPREMLSWMRVTKKFLRTWNETSSFDICMAHFALPGGEVGRWLKERFNIPYVVISHGHDIPWVHPRQMFFFHLFAYGWIKKICKDSTFNFIQTRMMKDNIDRFLAMKYSGKNVIIPNGVDPSIFYADHSKRPDKLRILFIGRLVIQKDPMTFLRALKIFSNHTRDFEVHILGDGNLRKKMERFILKNGLEENIRFLGKISEDQMITEYQSAHLTVAPSLNEGMSISALEALSCGVYLIATRASGYGDMISENINGEFIAFGDHAQLAERIRRFYEQDLNKGRKPKTPRLLPETFSWENICQLYHDTLNLLLK